MRKINAAILLPLCGLVIAGCEPESAPSSPLHFPPDAAQEGPAKPLPDNYADPDKPTMVPYYEVPESWEVSPVTRAVLRSGAGRSEPAMIWLDLYEVNDPVMENSVKRRLDSLTCVDGHSPTDAWLRCDRPLERSDESANGQTVPRLRYWGTWQGEDRQVDEYFFAHMEKIYLLRLEGGQKQDWQAVQRIIETLEFRYEVFVPGAEDEELGGL